MDITYSNQSVLRKPKEKEKSQKLAKKVSALLNINNSVTINEIYNLQCISKYPLSPNQFNGKPNNVNWRSTQLFMYDFDGQISVEAVLTILKNAGIICNFYYYTLNNNMNDGYPRFRVGVGVNRIITDPVEANNVRHGIFLLFEGKGDSKCNSNSRWFYGGNEGEFITDSLNDLDDLKSKIQIKLNDYRFGNHYISKDSTYQIEKIKGSLITSVSQMYILSFMGLPRWGAAQDKLNELDIFRKFNEGGHLSYNELFGLITNLQHLNGGLKNIKNTMKKYNDLGLTHYNSSDFELLTNVRNYDYFPMSLKHFSDSSNDTRFKNILEFLKPPKGTVAVLEQHEKCTLKHAESLFIDNLKKTLANNDNGIYLIKGPTSLGKSEAIKNIKDCLVCFPTHRLKAEVNDRAKDEVIQTPELPQFENRNLNEKISRLFKLQKFKDANAIISQVAVNINNVYSLGDCANAYEYQRKMKLAQLSQQTVFTTHVKGLFTEFNHKTIIFDECPMNQLLKISKIDLKDFVFAEAFGLATDSLKKVIEKLSQIKFGTVFNTNEFFKNEIDFIKDVEGNQMIENLKAFFNSFCFMMDRKDNNCIHFLNKNHLPMHKKIIILSATPNVEMYKKLYGSRVNVFELNHVESQGEIIQYTQESFSAESMKNLSEKFIENINESGLPVITFKSNASTFTNSVKGIYYFNSTGYDELKGKSIHVIGTPNKNECVYLMYAYAAGIKLDEIPNGMNNMIVEWKGKRFQAFTYSNEELRNIQLEMIEAEQLQAVGRARVLREDATVHFHGSIPLDNAQYVIDSTWFNE